MPITNENLDKQLVEEVNKVFSGEGDLRKIEELLQKGANPRLENSSISGKNVLEEVTYYSLLGGDTSKRMREVFFTIMDHGKNMEQENLDNALLQCCKDFINMHNTDYYGVGGLNDEVRIKMIKTLLDKGAYLKDTDLENLMNHSVMLDDGSLLTFDKSKEKIKEVLKEKIYDFAKEDNVEEVKKLLPDLYKSKNINKIRKFSAIAKGKKGEIEQLKKQRETKDNYDDMIKIDKAIEKKQKLIDTVKEFNENVQNKRNLDIVDMIMRGKNKGSSPEK